MQLFEIEQILAREGVQSQLEAAKKELKVLARECSMALRAVGVEQSKHPLVVKALAHCSSYYSSPAQTKKVTCSVMDLWKGHEADVTTIPVDKKELATTILGKNLVDTMVEEKRQPPDVSLHFHACIIV
jgi:hypothetical protein